MVYEATKNCDNSIMNSLISGHSKRRTLYKTDTDLDPWSHTFESWLYVRYFCLFVYHKINLTSSTYLDYSKVYVKVQEGQSQKKSEAAEVILTAVKKKEKTFFQIKIPWLENSHSRF